jgi:hypothetical protein
MQQKSSPPAAPYHPPPSYPPPFQGTPRLDRRTLASLLLAIAAVILGLPLGVPGLICGPIAYFMGRAAIARIDASAGALRGRSLATAAWILGIVGTAVGAVVSLVLLVLYLINVAGPPPA